MELKITILLLILSICISFAQYSSEYKLSILDSKVYPDAKCLDGSPGGYYLANGKAGTNKWILWFQGKET